MRSFENLLVYAPLAGERPLKVPAEGDNNAVAEKVRNDLGLGGWTLPWKTSRDAVSNLTFDLDRPGKSYTIHALFGEQRARVEERRTGWWQPLRALHAMGAVPNLPYTRTWGIYTEVCSWFTLFAVVSGLILWIKARRERLIGMILLLGASAASGALMAYVLIHG